MIKLLYRIMTAALVFTIAIAINGCNSKTSSEPIQELVNWNTYQGNAAHTGYVSVELNPDQFTLNWETEVNGSTPLNPVTAANGQVFVSTLTYFGDQYLFALNSNTGDIDWHKEYPGFHSVHPPATANDIVYMTTGGHGDTFLWAYDAITGDLIFKSPFGNQWSRYYAPTPYKNNIYINGGYYGGAYSFDAYAGNTEWFVSLNQYDEWTPAVNDKYAIAYTGEYSPELTVIDRLTGTVSFRIPDPDFVWNGWSMNLAPVLGDLNNVLAIHDGRLISFDLTSQTIGWQIDNQFSGQPSLANGVIYAVNNGSVEARSELNGQHIWSWAPGTNNIIGTMIITDNLLFCRTDTTTYALDINTQIVAWEVSESGHLALGGDGNLYLATNDGRVIAYKVF